MSLKLTGDVCSSISNGPYHFCQNFLVRRCLSHGSVMLLVDSQAMLPITRFSSNIRRCVLAFIAIHMSMALFFSRLLASSCASSSSHARQPSTTHTSSFFHPPIIGGPSPPHLLDASLPIPHALAHALAPHLASTAYHNHQQNKRLRCANKKHYLEEHEKTLTRVESVLNLRVLKVLS